MIELAALVAWLRQLEAIADGCVVHQRLVSRPFTNRDQLLALEQLVGARLVDAAPRRAGGLVP